MKLLCLQVSYLAADSLFPKWNIWTQFLDDVTSGLRLDALSESHPIEVQPVLSLHWISSMNLKEYYVLRISAI